MAKIENKIIAAALIAIVGLLIVLVSQVSKIKNRIADNVGVVVTAPALKDVNDRINENREKINSISADTVSIDQAARELHDRYR